MPEVTIDDTKESDLVDNSIQSANDNMDVIDISTCDESFIDNSEDLTLKKVSFQSRDSTVDSIASETSFLNEAEDWKGLNKKTNPIKPKISSNATTNEANI